MGERRTHTDTLGRRPRLRAAFRAGRWGYGAIVAAAALILIGTAVGAAGCAGILSTPSSGTTPATLAGRFVTEAELLSPDSGTFAICPDCHSFLDPPAGERPLLTTDFGHETHLERGAACEDCHPVPTHTEQGTRRPGMADCFGCHGQDPDAIAPGECSLCHPPDMPLVPSSHTDAFYAGGHAEVVARDGTRECFVCHPGDEQTFCKGCHGLDMPHPEGWVGTEGRDPGDHVDWAYQDAELCVQCHSNTDEPAPPGCYEGECHGP